MDASARHPKKRADLFGPGTFFRRRRADDDGRKNARGPERRRGFALIMVLITLAIMSLLLLALFGGASHQIRGAEGDASFAREKMLSDTAAALVIGQIQQA